jgi:hypothetical protein
MELDNNTILLLIVLAFSAYFFFVSSKEQLTNDNNEKQKLTNLIKSKFNESVSFENYKTILNMSGNTSSNLVKTETYNTLQELLKNNQLTEAAIKGFMTDI